MKIRAFLFVILTAVTFLSCVAGKYRVTHDFPEAMSATVKADYVRQWEKGRILYGMNCAKCHNKMVGRHEVIPDIPQEKLMGYELRLEHMKHGGEIAETDVPAEDLGLITIFLTYKKKNRSGVVYSAPLPGE